MHPDNRFYGHDRILAEYCHLPARPICGHLQHGWGPTTGYSQYPMRLLRSIPRLVWSDHNATHARATLGGAVHRVGAPFAYLLDMLGTPPLPPESSTLYFPAHGWERHAISGSYRELVDAIRDREAGEVTICLYWHEFEQPELRRRFADAGFRVITMGRRDDPSFLYRFADELSRHSRIAANNVGTPIWYGALACREVEVYGPRFDFGDPAAASAEQERDRERWPDLVAGGLLGERARDAARAELGAGDLLLEPAELAGTLGWDRPPSLRRQVLAYVEHQSRRAVVNVGMRLHLEGFR